MNPLPLTSNYKIADLMHPALNFFEIPTGDFQRAKTFYESIFNYTMPVVINEPNFIMGLLPADETAVGGALVWHAAFYKPSATDGILVYLNANPDLSVILQRVTEAGGKIVIDKRQVSPQFGFMAVFIDSEGNRLALHSKE